MIPKPRLSVLPSVCLSVCLSVPREKKSPWLRQYQSYISKWYINGKVFKSTTTREPKNLNFFEKVRNWILSVPRVSVRREKKSHWLRQHKFYVSNWYVNGKFFTSTSTWEPKIWFFFSKKFEIEFDLYFDLCWRAEINIQVGLNMHLYVDIGDASSCLWGARRCIPDASPIFLCIFNIFRHRMFA